MITISIIEDQECYRRLLVKAIETNSLFKIISIYASAEEAIIELPKKQPDIVIADIKLKVKTGIELIQHIRHQMDKTQFLICSSYQNDENVFNALKVGASGYIVKGSTSFEIQNAIIELFNGGSPMSPYIARKVISHLQDKRKEDNNFGLSEREMEVISLLSQGLLYKEISDKLNISQNTVKNHCKNIYKRLHVQNKIEALNKLNDYNFMSYATPMYVA